MSHIVAPNGSPMDNAVIGAASLSASRSFYEGVVGMSPLGEGTWQGEAFESYWHLPPGSSAQWVFLGAGPDAVGRVLLLEFDAENRQIVRAEANHRSTGLFNLNFYTQDIRADYHRLKGEGYQFWSEPVQHKLGPDVGEPIEVVFDGPDSVAINLVELATENPETRIGQMRAFVDEYGRTETGYTPVVTSSHGVFSREKAREFFESVLGMGILIDEVLDRPESNNFLRLEPDSRTRITFFQGNHMFGKVVTSEPQNYTCTDMTAAAVAPNIGYLAQSFHVADLARAEAAARALDVEFHTESTDIDLPGRGMCRAMIVRNPGSGALQEVFETKA